MVIAFAASPRAMLAMSLSVALAMWAAAAGVDSVVIRVNQVGYAPDAAKVAVLCAVGAADTGGARTFIVRSQSGRAVVGPRAAKSNGAFGPCTQTWRLDFSALRQGGRYTIEASPATPVAVRVGREVYAGAADTLLYYMRQQRSGFNPFFRDSVHRLDGYVIDDSGHAVKFQPVSGGWADASDYLQYVATSATATYDLLMAYRDYPHAVADAFGANGLAGANGVSDVLDEARHGVDWLLRMFPADTEMYNQLADDRDHAYFDLPTTDTSDYGWGKGQATAGVSVHRSPPGNLSMEESVDRPCIDRRQVRVGVRSGGAGSRVTRRFPLAGAAREGRSRLRTRPAISRCVSDRAGTRTLLLRGGQLGR